MQSEYAEGCLDSKTCTLMLEGHKYDLAKLSTDTGFKSTGVGDYFYYINICKAISKLPGPSCTNAVGNCQAGKDCSAFQFSKDGSVCYASGDPNSLQATFYDPTTKKEDPASTGLTIIMTSAAGECSETDTKRWFVVRLICSGSQGEPGKGKEIPGISCVYEIFWETPAGCPVQLSLGDWFLIGMAASCLVYFGGGYAYGVKSGGKSGAEALPNPEFWRILPDLVKDGLWFSVDYYKQMTGDGDYEAVGAGEATSTAGTGSNQIGIHSAAHSDL